MTKKMIYLTILLFSLGCVHTQNKYPEKTFQVQLNEKFTLQLKSGDFSAIDTSGNQVFYNITFNQVRGGETYLFGIWNISEKSGNKIDRLKILQEGKEIISFSITDLERKQTDFKFIDLNQFVQKE